MRVIQVFKTLLVGLALLSGFSSANTEPKTCGARYSTVVYFVNGIMNEKEEARKGMWLLERAYKAKLQKMYPHQTFEFKMAYNYSDGLWGAVEPKSCGVSKSGLKIALSI